MYTHKKAAAYLRKQLRGGISIKFVIRAEEYRSDLIISVKPENENDRFTTHDLRLIKNVAADLGLTDILGNSPEFMGRQSFGYEFYFHGNRF